MRATVFLEELTSLVYQLSAWLSAQLLLGGARCEEAVPKRISDTSGDYAVGHHEGDCGGFVG